MKSTCELTEPQTLLDLPPYLNRTDPMELDDLPLQVALLTMELAAQRQTLARLACLLETAARLIRPGPGISLDGD